MKKTPLSYKLARIHSGYSVSPGYSEYLLRSFVEMPVLSAKGEEDSSKEETDAVRKMLKTLETDIPIDKVSFGTLATVIVNQREKGFTLKNKDYYDLCEAFLFVLERATPAQYRRIQQRCEENDSNDKSLICEFLEVPYVEYRDAVLAAGVPTLTKHLVNISRALGIRDYMRLYDIIQMLSKYDDEQDMNSKIELFVYPAASLAKDAYSIHLTEKHAASEKRKEPCHEHE